MTNLKQGDQVCAAQCPCHELLIELEEKVPCSSSGDQLRRLELEIVSLRLLMFIRVPYLGFRLIICFWNAFWCARTLEEPVALRRSQDLREAEAILVRSVDS